MQLYLSNVTNQNMTAFLRDKNEKHRMIGMERPTSHLLTGNISLPGKKCIKSSQHYPYVYFSIAFSNGYLPILHSMKPFNKMFYIVTFMILQII